MENPLLSVIVPVYKAEKYIDRCINSILSQTLTDLELILVDDGSPDNSGAICDEYAKKDDRVKVVHKPNGGAASARNVGIDTAKGKYIGFCDADDFVDLDMYETLISIMEDNNLNTVECLAKICDSDGCVVEKDCDDRNLIVVSESDSLRMVYSHKGNVSMATRVTRSEYVKNIKIPEGKRVEDFYFTIILLTQTKGTTIYNYPFYNCTLSEGSVTRTGGGSIYIDGMYFFEKSVDYLSSIEYDLKTEQEYFLFKNYYLLFISSTRDERKKFKNVYKKSKRDLQSKLVLVLNNPYLINKEKIVLFLSSISISFARLLFILKNRGD